MPLDVLYDILGRLSPKDLLNIFRTNSLFKSTLEGTDAKATWREAQRRSGAPDPPPGFNEPQWARLLFEPKCENCGTSNIHEVDWQIRKRLCGSCKLAHLTGPRDKWFKGTYPGVENTILGFIPCTNSRPRSDATWDSDYRTRRLYWDAEIHSVTKKWKSLLALSNTARGRESLEEYRAERLTHVASCKQMADTCKDWESEYRYQREEEATAKMNSREEGVIQRFLSLDSGYIRSDVENAFDKKPGHRNGTGNVTDRVWKTIRPKLEPIVQQEKAIREETERRPLLLARQGVLDGLYTDYLGNLKSSDRYCCPLSSILHALPPARQVIDTDWDTNVTTQDFQPVVAQFPEYITAYQVELKNRLGGTALGNVSASVQPPPLENAERFLSLAKHVFRCQAATNQGWGGDFWMNATGLDQTLLGWTGIASHRCGKATSIELRPGVTVKKPPCGITLHEKSSPLSSTLIKLAGLDPEIATISDVDARNARFGVVEKSIPNWWTTDYMIFTWRGALHYFADEYHRHGIDPPTFRLARPEEVEKSEQHASSLRETTKAWSCNHCQDFFTKEGAETEPVVLSHVRARHGVENPQVDEDYVANPYLWPLLEAPCQIPLQFTTPLCYRRSDCSYSSNERFDLDGVRNHVQQTHHHPARPGYNFTFVRDLLTSYPG